MIDIHSHILPAVDDGASSLDESIMMAKLAVKEGIHTILATPHYMNGQYLNTKSEIVEKVQEINRVFSKESISLQVLPGQEPRVYEELLEDYKQCKVISLNDAEKYILLEFPPSHIPNYAEKLLYDIQIEGLIPIIVHPERNKELMENPTLLYHLVKKGALTQITAASVIGKLGSSTRKFTLQLIEANLTHFIASDAHDVKKRPFYMAAAYELVKKKFGSDYMELFLYNAEQVVVNKHVHKEMPEYVKSKKILHLF